MPQVMGLHTCVACERNSKQAPVTRWFDHEAFEWKYSRRCSWCGCVFPATKEEYEAELARKQGG